MISAVILTKNEENNIEACIKSVKWCDEILVVDDNSSDKTTIIAKKLGAKVILHSLENDFSTQRNFALSQAKGDWILFVDADERVSASLAYEISSVINGGIASLYNSFSVKRIDTMWGKKLLHGETGNIRLTRLFRKESGQWVGKVHEAWITKGVIGKLKNPLFHFPHQSVSKFLEEINFYTDLRAEELYKKKVKVYWWSIIVYPKGKFFVNYFIKQGFLDSIPGLVFALMMSFHSFLVRGKLWQLWHKK